MSSDLDSHRRPGLEFQYAFDICAAEARRIAGDDPAGVVLLAASRFYIGEIASRLPGIQSISQSRSPGALFPAPRVAICAEPDLSAAFDLLHRLLPAGAVVIVFRYTALARALPEVKSGMLTLQDISPSFYAYSHPGFRCIARRGCHTPISMLWWQAGRLMERIGRPDLADRCTIRARAAYAARGIRSLLTPLQLHFYRRMP